ncbi:MAG TPA: nucleoside hydrolase [Gemmataceae bacterium]|nr:nucleoside hydrolase [Gemmataceae bacterium]
MDLIIDTDLGHDPDDFFAILYLVSAGVNIRALLLSPGDPDQVAIARLICDEVGLNIPVGVSKPDRTAASSGGMHHELLARRGRPLAGKADGPGEDVLEQVFRDGMELFIIGPPSNVGKFLKKHPEAAIVRATMQGGFVPYSVHRPSRVLPQFEGKEWMPSYNPNGDRPGTLAFCAAQVGERRFVSKNVCHTVVYNREVHATLGPKDRASELFKDGMDLYLARHEGKMFHDPTAAVCHLHPEVATWVRGKLVKQQGGWSTESGGEDFFAVDLDYERLWQHITGMF